MLLELYIIKRYDLPFTFMYIVDCQPTVKIRTVAAGTVFNPKAGLLLKITQQCKINPAVTQYV